MWIKYLAYLKTIFCQLISLMNFLWLQYNHCNVAFQKVYKGKYQKLQLPQRDQVHKWKDTQIETEMILFLAMQQQKELWSNYYLWFHYIRPWSYSYKLTRWKTTIILDWNRDDCPYILLTRYVTDALK